MRKCQMCGYLALTDSEVCKHCGALLPRLTPALVAVGAPAPPPAPTLPPPAPREYWTPDPQPPAPARRRTGPSPRALLALITVVSMTLGWVAVERFLPGDKLPAGTNAFVSGHGYVYTSPDHTFQAQFPSAPAVEQRPLAVGTSAATLDMAQVQTDDYEIVAASLVLPGPIPASQVNSVLHDVLNEGAQAQGSTITTEAHVTRDGATGIEVRAKIRDGYDARLVVLLSGTKLYLLGVHSKSGTQKLYDALVRSLLMY